MNEGPSFPPLFRGEAVVPGRDPMERAISQALLGVDSGLVVHSVTPDALAAAVVLAPEEPIQDAMAAVFAASLGLSDALGALAPPEVAVQFGWPAKIYVNGARCGGLRAAASTSDPALVADWLVVALDMPFLPDEGAEPGASPDQTALHLEGCADVTPDGLLESWVRHFLVWINTWEDAGFPRLHTDWRGRAFDMGEQVTLDRGETGTFIGLDERGGMLLREGDETRLFPLSDMLETV